jgi:hypothetical protein
MPEVVLRDFLMDHGIDPPAPAGDTRPDWAAWWAERSPTWDDAQCAAAWQVLDRVRFYRVVKQSSRPTVYAVMQVQWGYNDEWFYPGGEGGVVRHAYRSRKKAELECSRLNARAREEWRGIARQGGYEPAGDNQFDMQERLFPGQGPFEPKRQPARQDEVDDEQLWTFTADEVPFFEVVEVELEGE